MQKKYTLNALEFSWLCQQLNKIKSALLATLFFITGCCNHAYSQNFAWAKQMGGFSIDQATSVSTDASGNVYSSGYFYSGCNFDPDASRYALTSAGGSDAFVSKLDASGNFLWAKQLGGPGDDVGRSLAVDVSGNVYICGYFNGTADFDPGPGTFNLVTSSGQAAFICKLDAAGNFVYAKQIIGSGLNGAPNDALSIALDGSGDVFVSGAFAGVADFDPGPGVYNLTAFGKLDAYVLKLDAAGNFVWAIQLGGVDNDYAYSVAVDASGNVYTSGVSFGSGDYDPGGGVYELTNAGGIDAYVCKLSPSGNFIWAKQIAGAGTDFIYSMAIDGSGNVYTTGYFTGTTYFDPGSGVYSLTSAAGSRDAYLCKFDPAGNVMWAKQFGGVSDDNSYAVAVDAVGNVYTTGTYLGTVDFDPGNGTYNLGTSGNPNAFISQLDASGNFIWAKKLGGLYSVLASAIRVDAGGSIYVAGAFQGITDFDPGAAVYNLTATGSNDIFVVKLVNSALSVKLLNFSATVNDKNTVAISWTTATEINNNYFTVERSIDGRSFEQVAIIKGAVNSSLPIHYQAVDNTSLPGKSYYRLRQTDMDGKFTYSAIVKVNLNESVTSSFTIYPNPLQAVLQVQLTASASKTMVWQVQDNAGRILKQQSNLSYGFRQTIDVSVLPNGIYYLVLKTDENTTVKKFIKQ